MGRQVGHDLGVERHPVLLQLTVGTQLDRPQQGQSGQVGGRVHPCGDVLVKYGVRLFHGGPDGRGNPRGQRGQVVVGGGGAVQVGLVRQRQQRRRRSLVATSLCPTLRCRAGQRVF